MRATICACGGAAAVADNSGAPALLLAALLLALGGCRSVGEHRDAADAAAYGEIGAAQERVHGERRDFSIDTALSGRDPQSVSPGELLQGRGDRRQREIHIAEALALATEHSREYQTQKETLFLAALALDDARHVFAPQWTATVDSALRRGADGEVRGTADGQLSVQHALENGASVGLTLAEDLLRFFTGDQRSTATTALSLDLTQPLARGGGVAVARERLTQAERDLIYAVRSFARFQKTFALEIVDRYYRLLQQRDTVRNQYQNFQNLRRARERAEALARDRLPEFQVSQARQDEFRARNNYIVAVERYQADLDGFKIQLGLPLGVRLRLDPGALAALRARGLPGFGLSEEQAHQRALETRLDLLNERDRLLDARRQLVLAVDALEPGIDLTFSASLQSAAGDFADFDADDLVVGPGVRLDLPLDQLTERNAYRRQLIAWERQARAWVLGVDRAREAVRAGLRRLAEARKRHQIQGRSVDLAARRVDSTTLLLQAGRAAIRDLLEAQEALVQARNAQTRALVDYHLARLELLRDIGGLQVDEAGLHGMLAAARDSATAATPEAGDEPLITPAELFGD